jgi:hypothetical protein
MADLSTWIVEERDTATAAWIQERTQEGTAFRNVEPKKYYLGPSDQGGRHGRAHSTHDKVDK